MGFAAQHIREARNVLRQLSDPIRDVIRDVGPFQALPPGNIERVLTQCLVLDQRIREGGSEEALLRLALFVEPFQLATEARSLQDDERLVQREEAAANPGAPGSRLSAELQGRLEKAAQLVGDGMLVPAALAQTKDDSIRRRLAEELTMGPVAADHFLMYGCMRLDILPADDNQLRVAIEMMDGGSEPLTESDVLRRSVAWQPWRTVATWYLKRWRLMKLGQSAAQSRQESPSGN